MEIEATLREAWKQVKRSYREAERCENTFARTQLREDGSRYSFVPWNELDLQVLFATKISSLYANQGQVAEIHHNWHPRIWYEVSEEFREKVENAFPPELPKQFS